jgi:hypothetical protein
MYMHTIPDDAVLEPCLAPLPLTTYWAGQTALKRPVEIELPCSRPPQAKQQESADRWTPPSPAAHFASVRCNGQRSTETSAASVAQTEAPLTTANNDRWLPPSPTAHFASARCDAQRSVDPTI